MGPRRPSEAVVAAVVARWNEAHQKGTRVRYWKGPREGEPTGEATTRAPAEALGGHTAVVWLDGVSGCIALTHVEVVR